MNEACAASKTGNGKFMTACNQAAAAVAACYTADGQLLPPTSPPQAAFAADDRLFTY